MEWTDKQRDAIEARGEALLLSAAAGSGKTTVMVSRILSLMREGADLSRMLVVTFTRAAAASMRRKIASELAKLIAAEPENEWLQKQQESLLRAQISTYDSFCAMVVRRYYYLLDCPPDFTVLDAAREELMRQETVQEVLEQAASEAESGELSGLDELYTALITGKSDTAVASAVLALHAYISVFPDPPARLQELAVQYDLPIEKTVFYEYLLSRVHLYAMSALEYCGVCRETVRGMDGGEAYAALTEQDAAAIEAYLQGEPGRMETSPAFGRIPTGKKRCAQEWLHEEYRQARDRMKEIVKEHIRPIIELLRDPEAAESMRYTGQNVRLLCELTRRFDERLLAKKHEKGGYYFSDIARFTVQALCDQAAAAELRDGYDYIFVDEYQDSNRVQEFILETLSKGDNLFLVGDVKQSIYRFRQAEPSLFVRRMNRFYPPEGRRIDLNNNFRSHSGVLEAVNLIFEKLMHAQAFEVEYDDAARLYPGENTWQTEFVPSAPCAELCLLALPQDRQEKQEDELLSEYAAEEAELLMLCGRIRELLGEEIFDAALMRMRPIRPGDIVILDQKAKSRAHHYQKIFHLQELPLVYDPTGGYLDSMEVGVMLDLMALFVTSRADEALLSVLLSPIGGFEADELAQMRAAHREGAFFEAFQAWAQRGEGQKAAEFLQRLEKWRLLSAAMQPEQFLWLLYEQTGFYSYVSALPGGAERCRNLALLASSARQYTEREGTGISGFLQYINAVSRLQTDSMDSSAAQSTQDAVRLMTIHKSKGLEFPVCVVAMTGKRLKGQGSGAMLTNHELGAALPMRRMQADGTVMSRKTIAGAAIAAKNDAEDRAEWLRLLYVAMTRAVNKLILTGTETGAKGEKAVFSQYNAVTAGSFLDWLVSVLANHRDGDALRALYGVHPEKLFEPSSWRVRVYTTGELRQQRSDAGAVRSETEKMLQGHFSPQALAAAERLKKRYEYCYPYAEAVRLKNKQGVTELTHERTAQPLAQWQPQEDGSLAAAERGSAYHAALERLDFSLRTSPEEQVAAMVKNRFLTEEQRASLDMEKLHALLQTPLARRMAGARLYRETPFTLSREQDGETVLVQGIIDCYFVEDGKAILVDYKSDRARGRREELCRRYAPQLALYKQALEGILRLPVAETLLVLLDTAEVVRLNL